MQSRQAVDSKRGIIIWLLAVCALIIAMTGVGGITRLTGSGLSIVDWKPIMGAIPPLSEADWLDVFARYQQSPQYKLVNSGMSLGDFKFIFFWEYIHRLLGRLIGLAFALPWLYFLVKGQLARPLSRKLGFALVLGGLQGFMGWFMVKSGLVDRPHVSHYRLAAHLSLALAVLSYLYWIVQDLMIAPAKRADPGLARFAKFITAGIALQIVYGAFTAGLKAGYGYNTFPKMGANWIPDAAFMLEPGWLNALANPAMVQFIHRTIGMVVLAAIGAFWWRARSATLDSRQRASIHALLGMVGVQFGLGLVTLLYMVPISLAAIHQLGACFLLLIALTVNHSLQLVPQRARNAN